MSRDCSRRSPRQRQGHRWSDPARWGIDPTIDCYDSLVSFHTCFDRIPSSVVQSFPKVFVMCLAVHTFTSFDRQGRLMFPRDSSADAVTRPKITYSSLLQRIYQPIFHLIPLTYLLTDDTFNRLPLIRVAPNNVTSRSSPVKFHVYRIAKSLSFLLGMLILRICPWRYPRYEQTNPDQSRSDFLCIFITRM